PLAARLGVDAVGGGSLGGATLAGGSSGTASPASPFVASGGPCSVAAAACSSVASEPRLNNPRRRAISRSLYERSAGATGPSSEYALATRSASPVAENHAARSS